MCQFGWRAGRQFFLSLILNSVLLIVFWVRLILQPLYNFDDEKYHNQPKKPSLRLKPNNLESL